MKRILLTGATGFLGSKLAARLLEFPTHYHVTVLKRARSNTRRIAGLKGLEMVDFDQAAIRDLFRRGSIDIIIHCATDYGRDAVDQSDIVETNLLMPIQLLDLGIRNGLSAFINTDTMLDKRVSSYTLSKRHFREWLDNVADRVTGVNVVLEHFYGAGDNSSKFVTHVIRNLLSEIQSIPLTRGEQKRDFIYIDDVVEAFVCILERISAGKEASREYQVGTGSSITLREFVATAHELCGSPATKLDFGTIPYRPNEPMDVHVDIAPLLDLGWRSRWPLREGLMATIDEERHLGL